MRVLVLEARGRIGGRTEPGTLAGHHVELGGGWFGPGQDLVARELKRYSLTTTEDVHATRMVMPGPNGYASHSPQEAGARLNSLFADFHASPSSTSSGPTSHCTAKTCWRPWTGSRSPTASPSSS
jgi:monoamine oxidase